MAPHRPRKAAPIEYATDDEDMITYDVEEEELEPDPTVKFALKENPINYPKGYLRVLTPTCFRKNRLYGLEVACLPRRSQFTGSKLTAVDRFSGCENHRHTYFVVYKISLEYQFGSGTGTLAKIKLRQYLASIERA
ncbi:hypothetical protein TNCV_4001951 [Trichonephila clavipes]|uniref:Uncharacterized protein n=1 Tax=Trichonephila clavipes TaxID=2585209 RepID=A0A8X6RMW6_TRICX|nr:hypothetical protein TNCV_4001951 [Trichonephila clavipes]